MNTLKTRLSQPRPLLAPGVYDALTALIAEQAGFEALYLSGASIAYTRLGRSDIGLTTATEVAETLACITERAPVWMQNAGLEWLFRVLQEPGRMWKRYLVTNSVFLWLLLKAKLLSAITPRD